MKIFCFEIKYTGWIPERIRQKRVRKEVLRVYIEKENKIIAIKKCRELTGLDLKAAKEYCETLQTEAKCQIARKTEK